MAVSVSYLDPPTAAVAPTPAQVSFGTHVTATVIATADADTTATITHNLELSAAALALGQPWVIIEPLLAAAQLSLWFVSSKTATTVVLTKATTTGSGNAAAQIQVDVLRPHTLIR